MEKRIASLIAALALAVILPARRAAASQMHTVVQGEHLWRLAGDYYKDHYKWRVIHGANTDKVKDPHWIYPGQVLVIPDITDEELGPAAPEEAAAPVKVEAPDEEAPVAAAEEPEDEPAPAAAAAPAVGSLGEGGRDTDDLSREMPKGMTAAYTNMGRVKVPKDWKEDGAVTVFEGREIMAAEGDLVNGKIKKGANPGDRFTVYRRAAAMELDADKKAHYLQRIGVVEVKEKVSGSTYRLLIRKSGDAVQLGDFLKKE